MDALGTSLDRAYIEPPSSTSRRARLRQSPESSGDKQLGNGIKCTFDSECASHLCTFSVCSSKSSGDKQLGAGVKCTFDSECASHQCTFSVSR